MTTEEAIKHFEAWAQCNYAPTREAAQMAITALRAQTDFNGTYVNVAWLKQVEAERDAAMKYIPHTCETCKWWHKVSDGMMCCKAPEELGKCYLGHGKAWQWRGINDESQRAD